MRILYLSQTYVPSERAGSVQTMRMCSALAELGHDVTLIAKKGACAHARESAVDVWSFYGLNETFALELVERPGVPGASLTYAWRVRERIRALGQGADLVFSRDLIGGLWSVRSGLATLFEVHEPPSGRLPRWLFRRIARSPSLRRVLAVSQSGARKLLEEFSIEAIVLPNGAALPEVAPPFSQSETVTVGFVGRFHRGKGAEMVIPIARRLPDVTFHVAGGGREDLERVSSETAPENVICHGAIPPSGVAAFLARLDIALLPVQEVAFGASGRSNLAPWTSPLKMFEYMAHGRAIVASDLPVLREILRHGDNALMVPAADADAWAASVRRLVEDPDLRRTLGRSARRRVEADYTWSARARRALEGI